MIGIIPQRCINLCLCGLPGLVRGADRLGTAGGRGYEILKGVLGADPGEGKKGDGDCR